MTDISPPAVIINFKAYEQVEGEHSIRIGRICQDVSETSGVCIAVCPPMVELSAVASRVTIPVFSQNVDPHEPGPRTGWVTPHMVKSTGASGTLINHSEHKVSDEELGRAIELCGAVGLESIVCAETVDDCRRYARMGPDYIAIEPPELIGGDVSVTAARPEVVEGAVQAVHEIDPFIGVFCGAGVKTGRDVKKALDLGADGVLLASGVVKSDNERSTLTSLLEFI